MTEKDNRDTAKNLFIKLIGDGSNSIWMRQTDKAGNWKQFAKETDQSGDSNYTKLVIDLDGPGPKTDKYTLDLREVPFNYEANTKSIFGI